jgi:alpha-glucosidase
MFQSEPELDLWKELPTVWDETKVLIDDIPNTVAVARRNGNH